MRITLAAGSLFHDRFLIVKELGAGGMGSVYLADQIDGKRKVAIKIMHSDTTDQDGLDRFIREFQVLSRMRHENIITFYSAAITNDGIRYAVCEFISGKTLSHLISESKKLDWIRVQQIALQICDALIYAESLSIIHRDLKPANIMLVDKPDPDTVKIIDFGLARISTEGSEGAMQKLTRTGEIMGSPHYMSPEQISGSKIDSRSDLYALACIIFEALSGKKLFDDSTHIRIMQRHAQEDAASVLQRELGKEGITQVLAKALQKDPAKRYKSAAEFKTALQASKPSSVNHAETLNSKEKLNQLPVLKAILFIAMLLISAMAIFYLCKYSMLQEKQDMVQKIIEPTASIPINTRRESELLKDTARLRQRLEKERDPARKQELFLEFYRKTHRLWQAHNQDDNAFILASMKDFFPYSSLAPEPATFRAELLEKITYQQIVLEKYDEARKSLKEAKSQFLSIGKSSPILEARLDSDEVFFLLLDHDYKAALKLLKQVMIAWYETSNRAQAHIEIQRSRCIQRICMTGKIDDKEDRNNCLRIANLILRFYLFLDLDADAAILAKEMQNKMRSFQKNTDIAPAILSEFHKLEAQARTLELNPSKKREVPIYPFDN